MPTRTTGTQSEDTDIDESPQRSQSTWGLVAGASLISTGLAAYEIVPASVTPLIRDSLQIGPTVAGFLVGVMFGTAVITSLPAGAVLDRTNTRNAMAFAVIILFLAGVWGWMAGRNGDYRAVIASRAVGGVAYVVVWNAGIDIVSRSVEPSRRATAVGVFTASGPVGFALGQGMGPLVAAWFGWPAIFLAFNGIALVGLVLFWPTSRGLGHSSGDTPTLAEFRDVLRNKNVWLVGGLGFLGYSLYLFVNSWGASYLTQEVGLSLGLSGVLVAVFPAIGILARVSSGPLSDRLFSGRRQPIVFGSFFIAAPLVAGFTYLQSVTVLITMLLVAGFAIQLTLGLSFTYVRELVDPRVAATAVAFQTSVGLAGAFIAPIAGGAVVDIAGFDTAFLVAGGLAVLGVTLAWWAPEPAKQQVG
ncbi:MFS transporter [Halosimplex pelagicum]|uniref:MFS transporter n=1 Tax=Halosimplex pelagicum TaxID=869886 RepID=A0A7D5P993_9EURY|nr:MFS transporter [Halosimplex pelagicum]QLH82421.1 MFS transporter [Halosimplex pelagicum]